MVTMRAVTALTAVFAATAHAQCPYMAGDLNARDVPKYHPAVRDSPSDPGMPSSGKLGQEAESTDQFLSKYEIDDGANTVLTSDAGGPISDDHSLKAGERGPTLLEDFIFRQKIQHFDHERVPERAVHARGAGAHGVFKSYGDWSNITAASFLKGSKDTPVFIRFSTVAGSRGSADTARDVHGFAVRFYTDEGNYDIVGNNIPVFFIQDAILFPDLIHSVKPRADNEIPQAATAHDTAWDFFGQQPSTMHTLLWAMSPHGIVRSYRHMDGFGVHTFRFVTDEGKTKLVKFRFKTLQGKASLVWEEAQATAGNNADAHRQDLFEAIDAGRYPEWEFQAQIMEEDDQLRFGFDLMDPTKIVPEDLVPFTPLGKLTLNRNPRNYFAETEQVMFQPGHVVRGIDFSEDPLLQGRLYSYLDTQLNRNGGPNFEQLPINQPRVPWHNNNRDGAGQMFIPTNIAPYSPNTLNKGFPAQANQTQNKGFFTAPNRGTSGRLVRATSPTFANVWSQPRLFFNSLLPAEQQFIVNAIRFETAHLQSATVRDNALAQINRISNDLAARVAKALGVQAPAPDPTYYHNNKTIGVSVFENKLLKLDGLKVGYLSTMGQVGNDSFLKTLKGGLKDLNVDVVVVAETLADGVDQTYSAAGATGFDAVIAGQGTAGIMTGATNSTLYPTGRPLRIFVDAYNYGKPVAVVDASQAVFKAAGIAANSSGVRAAANGKGNFVQGFADDLRTFKFLDRFPLDE